MRRSFKFAINLLASLVLMVSGTVASAQADEIGLDFSLKEANVTVASKSILSQPYQTSKFADNTNLTVLDFNVPKVETLTAPIAVEVPIQPKPGKIKAKQPLLKSLVTNTSLQQVTALRRAIIGQESAGKFWLINPDSGALGYGQLMKENVAPWTKAALGKPLTVDEFLNNPELQIKTIDHKLDQYLQRELTYTGGGNQEVAVRRVASAWYSGNPNFWNDTNPQYSNGRRYPSIENYTRSVWLRYQREIG